jgi:hypothetical protein
VRPVVRMRDVRTGRLRHPVRSDHMRRARHDDQDHHMREEDLGPARPARRLLLLLRLQRRQHRPAVRPACNYAVPGQAGVRRLPVRGRHTFAVQHHVR